MNFIKNKKNQTGVILLLTLFILSGILVITLAAADLVLAGIRMNRLTGYSGLAFFAAEAGLERSLWQARQPGYNYPEENQDDFLNCNPTCPLTNGSNYKVAYATSTPNVSFTSIGSYRRAKRSVQSTYNAQ